VNWKVFQKRNQLTLNGWQKADQVKYAETFEICEYGSYPDDHEIKQLFPMLGKTDLLKD
jgi:hypothetical protein